MTVKTITHAILGKLMPVQGPYATYLSPDDDFDLALYIDGDYWMAKLELDYHSMVSGRLETVEKEFALDKDWLEKFGRGYFVNKFEELFDTVANEQLVFIPLMKRVEVRESIMHLMQECFDKIDAGVPV